MWLKLCKNRRSSVKNRFIHSNSASNVDEKWSKNHDALMRPYKVIAPKISIKNAGISIFDEFYTAITL